MDYKVELKQYSHLKQHILYQLKLSKKCCGEVLGNYNTKRAGSTLQSINMHPHLNLVIDKLRPFHGCLTIKRCQCGVCPKCSVGLSLSLSLLGRHTLLIRLKKSFAFY